MLLYTGEIVLFSCSIRVGLLDSASAKIKAIGAQLPAEFYLLASHSLHRISWHSAALVCEACDRCCLLQDIDSKLQWCHLCGPVESFCGGAVCQCSCLQVQRPGHAKESLCLTFLLHLCSHGLLVVAQKVPRSHKRNVGGLTGGGGWTRGEGWQVQHVFTPALLITMQNKPVTLIFCSVLWKHSVQQPKLVWPRLVYWQIYERNEHRAAFLSKSKSPALVSLREKLWRSLQALLLTCGGIWCCFALQHSLLSWVPADIHCFVMVMKQWLL